MNKEAMKKTSLYSQNVIQQVEQDLERVDVLQEAMTHDPHLLRSLERPITSYIHSYIQEANRRQMIRTWIVLVAALLIGWILGQVTPSIFICH